MSKSVKVTNWEALNTAVRRYVRHRDLVVLLGRAEVVSVEFRDFIPNPRNTDLIGALLTRLKDGRWIMAPMVVGQEELRQVIQNSYDPAQSLFTLLNSRLEKAIQDTKEWIYEDPFVTWAKEVIRNADNEESSESVV